MLKILLNQTIKVHLFIVLSHLKCFNCHWWFWLSSFTFNEIIDFLLILIWSNKLKLNQNFTKNRIDFRLAIFFSFIGGSYFFILRILVTKVDKSCLKGRLERKLYEWYIIFFRLTIGFITSTLQLENKSNARIDNY